MSNDIQPTKTEYSNASLDIIRSETALSRYPIHRLANKGLVNIEIRRKDEKGNTIFLWEVSYTSRYGQPGPLAYKLDTQIINRRIDEAGRPISKILKLGSLREIAEGLDLGGDTSLIKKALRQNASSFITAKTTYKGADGTEHTFEFSDTRYGVIFTGEKLPNGMKADAVFLVFHDLYLKVLNTAPRRPLDYDYLRSLPPGPQRFYEIVSYQMLPAIKYNQRAKLPYSEFCMYSTMTRYETFEQMKKQMWKIHQSHIKSGYLAKVEYEPTTDEQGRPDWNMFYIPGERARFQQLVFSFEIPQVRKERAKPIDRATPKRVIQQAETSQGMLPILSAPVENNEQAASFVKTFYRLRFGGASHTPTAKEVEQAVVHLASGEEWAKYLVQYAARYGKEQGGFPENFGGIASLAPKIRGEFDSHQQKQEVVRLKKTRQSHQDAHRDAYHTFLGELLGGRLESALPEAFAAFSAQEKSAYQFHKARAAKSKMSAQVVEDYYSDAERVRRLLQFIGENPKSGIPNFWQWDEKINPASFQEPK